jgi:hypothetical protein
MKKILILLIILLIPVSFTEAQFNNGLIISLNTDNATEITGSSAKIKANYVSTIFSMNGMIEYSKTSNLPHSDTSLLSDQFRTQITQILGNPSYDITTIKNSAFVLTNLDFNTTYYYRFCLKDVFKNSGLLGGHSYECSSVKSFTTLPFVEKIYISNVRTTCPPPTNTPVTDTTANLCGSADISSDIPEGAGYGYFRYSTAKIPPIFCNDIYGNNMSSTKEIVLNPGSKKWNTTITNLNPDTTYYYCSVVSNNTRIPSEIKYGGVASFRTLPCPTCEQKNIETKKITATNKTSASLRGAYNFTKAVNVYFEYQEAGSKINSDSILGLLGLGGVELTSGASLGGTSTGRTNNNTGGSTENRGTNSIAQDLEIPASSIWKTTSKQNKSAGNNGDFSTNVTGLKEGKRYLYRAVAEIISTGEKLYGFTYDFTTLGSSSSGDGTGDGVGYGNDGWTSDFSNDGYSGGGSSGSGSGGSSGGSGGSSTNNGSSSNTGTLGGGVFGGSNPTPPPAIGQLGNPSSLSLVGNEEGIETVFIRQIMGNQGLAKRYGYREGTNLQAFAENLAHTFAQAFGYVSIDGREVRVIVPNKAAYEIGLVNNVLVVYEFFDNRLTGIATTNGVLKTPLQYEYYFNKR